MEKQGSTPLLSRGFLADNFFICILLVKYQTKFYLFFSINDTTLSSITFMTIADFFKSNEISRLDFFVAIIIFSFIQEVYEVKWHCSNQ